RRGPAYLDARAEGTQMSSGVLAHREEEVSGILDSAPCPLLHVGREQCTQSCECCPGLSSLVGWASDVGVQSVPERNREPFRVADCVLIASAEQREPAERVLTEPAGMPERAQRVEKPGAPSIRDPKQRLGRCHHPDRQGGQRAD